MTEAKQDLLDSRQLYSGLIRLHILHHAAKEGIFGLGMIEELARHGYKLSPGTLYPILHGLEENGLLRSHEHAIGGKIRRTYRTTTDGQRVLSAAKGKVRELFGELFEDEPVIERARTRSRVVTVQAANYRKRSTANTAL
jgi:PadR family transcriptional regulator, regulatory protein PadR